MHDIISFLKSAVTRTNAGGSLDCYLFDGETVRASNDHMHAGIAWPSKKKFALPAGAVDAFLSRVEQVNKIKVEDNTVILKSGRLQSTIDRRFEDPLPLPTMPGEWQKCPVGLTGTLKMAQAFTAQEAGARLWMTAIRLFQDRISAGNGQMVIDVTLPGLEVKEPKLLSSAVVDFLIAQGDPDEFGEDANTVTFRWDDGRWVRCQLIDSTMDEATFQRIFGELVGKKAPVLFSAEWGAGLADAVALADTTSVVEVNAKGMLVTSQSIRSHIEFVTGVSKDHQSWWNGKNLAAIAAVAKSWNPEAYPDKPSLFLGETAYGGKLRGAISGHSRQR